MGSSTGRPVRQEGPAPRCRCSQAEQPLQVAGALELQRRLVAGSARQGVADALLPTARGSPAYGGSLSGGGWRAAGPQARRRDPALRDIERHAGRPSGAVGSRPAGTPPEGARWRRSSSPGRGGVDGLKASGPASLENMGTSREGAARA